MANIGNKLGDLAVAIVRAGKPKLQTFLYYAKVELVPPSPKEIPEIKRGIGKLVHGWKSGSWKNLTVKEAFLNGLITTEVVFWFFFGECIGRRHLVGYDLSM